MRFDEDNARYINIPPHDKNLVYYLIENGEVVYVGMTRSGLTRVFQHDGEFDFDSVAFIDSDVRAELDESRAIAKYQPKHNRSIGSFNYTLASVRKRIENLCGERPTLRQLKGAMQELGITTFSLNYTDAITHDDMMRVYRFLYGGDGGPDCQS